MIYQFIGLMLKIILFQLNFILIKLSLLPILKLKIASQIEGFDYIKRKVMLRNPKLYTHFIKGVAQYRRQKYDQAAQYFLTSMAEYLHGDHEFSTKKQKQKITKLNDENILKEKTIYEDKKQNIFCGSFQGLLNLSCCLIKQKQYAKAQKICYRALQLNAYNSVPHYNLATINIKKENYLQALNQIKCALSCEYLKKYERIFDKKDLDMAIDLVPNNLSAIRYRISFNTNFLRIMKLIGCQNVQTQASIYQQQFSSQKNENNKKSIVKQLQSDIEMLKRYNRIYEVQFNTNNAQFNKQNLSNNLYVSTVKPQFILQSKKDQSTKSIGKNNNSKQNLQNKLKTITELKSLREEYLRLVCQNQKQIEFQDIITSCQLSQKYVNLLKNVQSKGMIDDQSLQLKCKQENNDEQYENTVQTSFQLQDSYQTLQQQRQTNVNNKNDQNNHCWQDNNKKQSLIENNHNNPTCNRNNNKLKPLKLSENQYLSSSIISIQDYQQNQITQYQNIQNHNNQIPQYKVNLIQSVIVPNQSHNKSTQLFQIQQNTKSYDHSLLRNKSSQSLINNLLSPVKDLKKSQYQFYSRLTQSKSQHNLMSCSKCSMDHYNDFHRQKNVNLQINLTQIYNYDCDFSELQTFCVIKHDGQQLKTQTSKGKFPNWKQKIQFNVDFHALNSEQHQSQRSYYETNQNNKVKIQLWAKRTHFKKDSFLNPNDLSQLIGQQEIDLREQKWTKKKIILQNRLNPHQKRKTAYMYVCLQKIKPKKV